MDGEFLAASRKAVSGSRGSDALDALGWWDLLGALDDRDARAAAFALFRAQGIELGDTGALGALVAAPCLAGRDGDGSVVAAVARASARRGLVHVLVGDVRPDRVLLDVPGRGARLVAVEDVTVVPIEVPGRVALHEIVADPGAGEAIDEESARRARPRAAFLGRVALGFEMLGAAQGALDLALEHARNRFQFGQPIGTFQAVRHLLAWAVTDCAAVEAVTSAGRDLDAAAPPRFDEVVKALAGRNARRVCERTLQVLGGIGFTTELDHHHFHSRVLALDSILGSSTELAAGLGSWLRTERPDPGFAGALLFAAADAGPARGR